MNKDLRFLRDWAEARARDDDDETARPLWAQIAGEVSAHLETKARLSDTQEEPLW